MREVLIEEVQLEVVVLGVHLEVRPEEVHPGVERINCKFKINIYEKNIYNCTLFSHRVGCK